MGCGPFFVSEPTFAGRGREKRPAIVPVWGRSLDARTAGREDSGQVFFTRETCGKMFLLARDTRQISGKYPILWAC